MGGTDRDLSVPFGCWPYKLPICMWVGRPERDSRTSRALAVCPCLCLLLYRYYCYYCYYCRTGWTTYLIKNWRGGGGGCCGCCYGVFVVGAIGCVVLAAGLLLLLGSEALLLYLDYAFTYPCLSWQVALDQICRKTPRVSSVLSRSAGCCCLLCCNVSVCTYLPVPLVNSTTQDSYASAVSGSDLTRQRIS